MANESEKSEACIIEKELANDLHELMARHAAKLITAGAEKTLNDAVAHVSGHMLDWMVTALWSYHQEDPVRVASSLMAMLASVARDAGVNITGGVVTGDEIGTMLAESLDKTTKH